MKKMLLGIVVAALSMLVLANIAFAEGGSGTASDRVMVQTTDIVTSGQAAWVKPWVQDLADRWQRTYGWNVPQTINVYLYSNGTDMANAFSMFLGRPLTAGEMGEVSMGRGAFTTRDMRANGPGGWAVLVNVGSGQFGKVGAGNWMNDIKGAVVMQLAELMINDMSGSGGPTWMRVGFINYLAQTESPYLTVTGQRMMALNNILTTAQAPGLVALHNNWNGVVTTSPISRDAALAIATMTVGQLVKSYGPMAIFNMLGQTSAGGTFETIFQRTTGVTIQQMDQAFRSSM